MNKLSFAFTAAMVALVGCSESSGTFVVVRVEQGTAPEGITKLNLKLNFAGQEAIRDLDRAGAALTFPISASFEIGDGEGELVVTTLAFDAAGLQVGTGVGTTLVVRGATREAVVTLSPSSGNVDPPDGSIPITNDGSVMDTPVAIDAPDAGTTMPDAAPDVPAAAKLVANRNAVDFGPVVIGMNAAVAIQVSNMGKDVSGALMLSLSGSLAFSLASDVCSGKGLMPAESCVASVVFAPGTAGALAGELTITGLPGGELKVDLKGTGLQQGALKVDPAMTTFADTQQGLSSPEIELTVSNTGGTATGALTVAVSGNDSQDFALGVNACANALPAAGTCKVGVKFAPKSAGAKSASVTITGMPGGTAVANVAGTGLAPAALEISPLSNNFGSVVSGQKSGNFAFKVTNKGGVPSAAPTASIAGAMAEHFVIGPNSCTTAVPAGGECQVEVQFGPTAVGAFAATLEVSAGALKVSAALTGTGLAAGSLEITPSSHVFDPTIVGAKSANRVFTVRNAGGANTGALSGMVTGSHPNDFLVVANACAGKVLTPAETCTVTLQLQPSAAGPRSASLTLSAAPGGNVSAQMSGQGLTPASLSLSPAGETFGSVVVGGTSERTFTVTNTGDQASGTLSIAIAGTHSGDFTLLTGSAGDCINGTTKLDSSVPSCNVRVRFTAMSLGNRTAALNVSATPGGMKSATLSGTGLAQGQLTSNASSHGFGLVEVGATSSAFVWRITNVGGVPSGVPMLSVSPAAFVVANGCTFPLPAGASCEVTISFKPSSGGVQNHNLTLTASPGGSTQIALSGRGGFRLTVQTSGTGKGLVASSPSGIRCPNNCGAVFETGASVNLAATTENGSNAYFRSWSGACSGPYNQCTVTMSGPVTVGAVFAAMDHNLVFVSSDAFPATLGGASAYDEACNKAASKAGINSADGDGFTAWLSDEETSPVDRLKGAEGWVRRDGLPVALTLGGLIKSNEILNPIALDEYGNDQGTNGVFTGTTPAGAIATGQTCASWRKADPATSPAVGDRFSGPTRWTQAPTGGNTCGSSNRLYCFGRLRSNSPTPSGIKGPRIYLTSNTFAPGGGFDAAVELCSKELPPNSSGAMPLLSSVDRAAADFLDPKLTYVSVYGERIGTAEQIMKGTLGTGIWITSSGVFVPNQIVYTGASEVSSRGASVSTCSDWKLGTSLAGTPFVGVSSSSRSPFWVAPETNLKDNTCTLARRIYCVER